MFTEGSFGVSKLN